MPAFSTLMDYAIIKLGNKQHRVKDGETLVVDRLHTDEGKTFEPVVLLGDTKVTAKVLAHERGPKIIIGKYRKRTGYKRHNGFRAATSRVEITLGSGGAKRAVAKTEKAPDVETAAGPAGLPDGYAELTVAEVGTAAKDWSHEQIEAALAYEQANAARKGAVSALESALAKEDEA